MTKSAEARALALASRMGEVEKATLAKAVPDASAFLYELKYDGYRFLGIKAGGTVRLVSRKGHDWSAKFPAVVAAIAALAPAELVIDGEVCALDPRGVPSFNLLQNANAKSRVVYVVFDMLWVDGRDLRIEPIEARRAQLERILARKSKPSKRTQPPILSLSAAVDADPKQVLRLACELGFEGIVAKRRSSPYTAGRTKDWLKIKCTLRQEFAIIGYLPYLGTTNDVGSLLLGIYEGGEFRFAGKVGTGFSEAKRRELAKLLEPDRIDRPAVRGAPNAAIARWVKPKRVAEIAFTEWTPDGRIRHPSFQGLRMDKAPEECVRERATPLSPDDAPQSSERPIVAGVSLSKPERVLFVEPPRTKLALAHYYEAIGDAMVPHVRGRPLTLVRIDDTKERGLFLRHAKAWGPRELRRVKIREKTKVGEYLVADTTAALVALAQMDILEIHTWNANADAIEKPDRIVFDLDPGPEVSWARVIEAARRVRERLADLGLESWLKTTGGKGLHVVVPLAPRASWDECVAFSRGLARALVRESPKRYSASMPKEGREDKIFIDYLRNVRAGTSVAAFSPRARPGAPVSTPLAWDELEPKLMPRTFTLATVPARLRSLGADPWAGYFEAKQRLTAKMLAAVSAA